MTSPLDALSPTALVQLRVPQTPTPFARAKYRMQTRLQVLGCQGCELHKHQPSDNLPVSFSSPRAPAFVVVGEAPGPEESATGIPFIGKSGRLLRALMKDVGIDATDDVLWTNTVSCFPNVQGTIRKPTPTESTFCRDNMFTQIEAAYVPFVLLVGGTALNAFRSDLQITNHHGKLFVWNELYAVMGIPHPAAVLRGRREYKKQILLDLERWAEIVWSGDDPLAWLETRCIRCGGEWYRSDRDGVAYCATHWENWKNQWMKEREKWAGAKIEQLTF